MAVSVLTARLPCIISFSCVGDIPICLANAAWDILRASSSSLISSPGCVGSNGVRLLAIMLGSMLGKVIILLIMVIEFNNVTDSQHRILSILVKAELYAVLIVDTDRVQS